MSKRPPKDTRKRSPREDSRQYDPSEHCLIDRFCAIEGEFCHRFFTYRGSRSCFLAYPGTQPWQDSMNGLASELRVRGYRIQSWEGFSAASTMFQRICKAIHANELLIAEISQLNPNVLFEVGYALAVGRDAVLLSDRNRRLSTHLGILQTKYQCFYEKREDILVFLERYHAQASASPKPNRSVPLMDTIDRDLEREGQVYVLPAWSDDVTRAIQKLLLPLKRKSVISDFTVSDPSDSLFDSFLEQARLIATAEYVLGILVSDSYSQAVERNAPVALLLGLSCGMGKEVLILQESPSKALMDVGTILHQFSGEQTAWEIAKRWFDTRVGLSQMDPQPPHSDARDDNSKPATAAVVAQRERRRRRARIRFFGPPDATLDHDLMEYFVETPEFEAARTGDKELFVGRKGVGKSSNFLALSEDIRRSHDMIPVMITPIDLEYEQLSLVLEQIGPIIHPNFLYPSFWKFIILTEIVRVIQENPSRLATSRLDEWDVLQIERVTAELDEPVSADFSTRIMNTLQKIHAQSKTTSPERVQEEVEKIVSKARLYRLEDALANLAKIYPVHVAIDDIDKRWNPEFHPSIPWLRGLLNEMNRIRRHFGRGMRSTIFLREDIYDRLRDQDPDYSNRSIFLLRWEKRQLAEVIAARVEFLTNQSFDSVDEAWQSLFDPIVNGTEVQEYLIERTLMRPRDLIQFCQLSLEHAQRRDSTLIAAEDVLGAESTFSQYLFDSVRTEYLLTYPGLDVLMRAFQGSEARDDTFSSELQQGQQELRANGIIWAQNETAIMRALYEAGFIGLGKASRSNCDYSWSRSFEDARRSAAGEPRLCIHPGFHSYLEIQKP